MLTNNKRKPKENLTFIEEWDLDLIDFYFFSTICFRLYNITLILVQLHT